MSETVRPPAAPPAARLPDARVLVERHHHPEDDLLLFKVERSHHGDLYVSGRYFKKTPKGYIQHYGGRHGGGFTRTGATDMERQGYRETPEATVQSYLARAKSHVQAAERMLRHAQRDLEQVEAFAAHFPAPAPEAALQEEG